MDDKAYERMLKEVPKILCITRSMLCEKFKINGSVARALIKDLAKKQLILPVGQQSAHFDLYKGSQAKSASEKAAAEEAEAAAKKKKWAPLISLFSSADRLISSFMTLLWSDRSQPLFIRLPR